MAYYGFLDPPSAFWGQQKIFSLQAGIHAATQLGRIALAVAETWQFVETSKNIIPCLVVFGIESPLVVWTCKLAWESTLPRTDVFFKRMDLNNANQSALSLIHSTRIRAIRALESPPLIYISDISAISEQYPSLEETPHYDYWYLKPSIFTGSTMDAMDHGNSVSSRNGETSLAASDWGTVTEICGALS